MIKRKELLFLRHVGLNCVGFSYCVEDKNVPEGDRERNCFCAEFTKGETPGEWNMRVILDRTRDADSQVYNFSYQLPRDGLPLELIAATGLKYYQLYLQEEIQRKSNYNFVLGELLKDV